MDGKYRWRKSITISNPLKKKPTIVGFLVDQIICVTPGVEDRNSVVPDLIKYFKLFDADISRMNFQPL